ncbi:UDP-3-O-acylglucosamine N-acyltransferase [Maioricimonas rarisocia]|uniref:UDP-3-O-acylglucosamine N-acyltransferase n=1 Tax=Maioricimonas rarisocia TaxID=2528026 RepID=A0A517ZBQ9_9PLAN|nr:UDP-3-O-(3-hydroxymyristoyl)glucosamine N-acyltransferase [Maioricimonas rarisocia]QDU39897.1 UDP-3-O-acylglucosamine N-acyltransferase [Maioricimonas rarisocia]
MRTTVQELCELLGGTLAGDGSVTIDDVASPESATPDHIVYTASPAQYRRLEGHPGAVILDHETHEACPHAESDAPRILVEDPQAAFIQAMLHFRPPAPRQQTGISPHAFVDPSATIGEDCNIHPGAHIGPGVTLGKGCDIHPGVVIAADCRLGDNVTVYPNAVLYAGVSVGNRVIIHATAVIGADGFGYRLEQGRFAKIPHTGTVVLEDDVEIGAGTTVDRAMIGATVIGEGTKLDNQVMIAHNCQLGKHNAYASQVGFAGSVTTGDYVRCAGQVGVADHAHIGTGSTLGAKAGIRGTVPDGETYHGIPAGPEREQIKLHLTLRKVPEMRSQLGQLARQVQQLQDQIENLNDRRTGSAAA